MPDRSDAALSAESSIVGALLLDSDRARRILRRLTPEMFSDKRYAAAFSVIQALLDERKPVDLVTVSYGLASHPHFANRGDAAVNTLLEECVERVGSIENAGAYAEDVRRAYQFRVIQSAATTALNATQLGEAEPADITGQLSASIDKCLAVSSDLGVVTPDTYAERRVAGLRKRMQSAPHKWGFAALNKLLPRGPVPVEITVIAGLSGVGKSTLKNNMIWHWLQSGLTVVSFVQEMGFDAEADRLEALGTNIPVTEFSQVYRWSQSDRRKEIINREIKMAKDRRLYFVPSKAMTVTEAGAVLRSIAVKQPIDVVTFDLFDRLQDVAVEGSKTNVVHRKLVELSAFGQELDFHTVLVVQVRRDVRSRTKQPVPRGDDIKDSSAYYDSADVVIIIDRESIRTNIPVVNDVMDVYIDKNRVGPRGRTRLLMETPTMRLKDLPDSAWDAHAEGEDVNVEEAIGTGREAESGG